jgi:hypothetical protein
LPWHGLRVTAALISEGINLILWQHVTNIFSMPFGSIVDKDASENIVSNESPHWCTFRELTIRFLIYETCEIGSH